MARWPTWARRPAPLAHAAAPQGIRSNPLKIGDKIEGGDFTWGEYYSRAYCSRVYCSRGTIPPPPSFLLYIKEGRGSPQGQSKNPSRHPLSHLLSLSRSAWRSPVRGDTSPPPPPSCRAAGIDLIYYSFSLAGSRRRSRHRAVRVHISEVPLVAVLIGLEHEEIPLAAGRYNLAAGGCGLHRQRSNSPLR